MAIVISILSIWLKLIGLVGPIIIQSLTCNIMRSSSHVGGVRKLMANIIIESIHAQFGVDGNEYLM